jgi:hypothetical protein
MLSGICNNFQVRTRNGFTGPIGRVQGATFIMVNASALPCTSSAFDDGKDVHVATFVVVAVHAEGLARAPFKYNDKTKKNKESKPLTATDASGNMQFWSYQKKGSDKGDRIEDVTWTLSPGTTLKFFFRAEDCEKVFVGGAATIPAHSVCEVALMPKSSEPCAEGWGFSVRSVRVSPLSLYSYLAKLDHRFHGSREEAKRALLSLADKEQPIRRVIDNENPAFCPNYIDPSAFTQHAPELGVVKLWKYNGNESACIDIAEDAALRYTNAADVDAAMRLLEIAVACGALRMLVFTSEFRSRKQGLSECFGVPVVDTSKLLACVTADNCVAENAEDVVFLMRENCSVFTATAQKLYVAVAEEGETIDVRGPPASKDLILVTQQENVSKAHKVPRFRALSLSLSLSLSLKFSVSNDWVGAAEVSTRRRHSALEGLLQHKPG